MLSSPALVDDHVLTLIANYAVVVRPEQFYAKPRLSPEKSLLLALIENLHLDLLKEIPYAEVYAPSRYRIEADLRFLDGTGSEFHETITGGRGKTYPFTFRQCCAELGLDPQAVRDGILDSMGRTLVADAQHRSIPRRRSTPHYGKERIGRQAVRA